MVLGISDNVVVYMLERERERERERTEKCLIHMHMFDSSVPAETEYYSSK